MRKKILTLLLFTIAICAGAQEREIKMPNDPSRNSNIAEMEQGFWCSIEIGGGSTAMEGRKNIAMAGAEFTGGYRLSQYLRAGVGIGVLYYPNNDNVRDKKSHLAMPLYINARGNMLSEEYRRTVPYWSVNVGTTLPDGFFFSPAVGLRIGEKRNAFLISVGYTLRKFSVPESKDDSFSGALLKLGYEF